MSYVIDYQAERVVLRSMTLTLTADDTAVNETSLITSPAGVGGRCLVLTPAVAGTMRIAVGYGGTPDDPSAIATVDDSGAVVRFVVGVPVVITAPIGTLITHVKLRGTGTTSVALILFNK